jgi:hypothetical protein
MIMTLPTTKLVKSPRTASKAPLDSTPSPTRRTRRAKNVPVPAPQTAATPLKLPAGKLGLLVALLQRGEGASLEAMMGATGWQKHSVRGAIAGALKKKVGLTILSEKTEAGRIYRIPASDGANEVAA